MHVRQIRALLAAGMSTWLIRLSCSAGTGVLDTLRQRLSDLDRQAADLDAARALLKVTIATAERSVPGPDRDQPDRKHREDRHEAERQRVTGIPDDKAQQGRRQR